MALPENVLRLNKMTKRFLMSLPENVYIVSNVGDLINGKFVPLMAVQVLPLEKREQQWKKIKEANCNNRCFEVFKNKQDWEKENIRKNEQVKKLK